MVSYNCNKYQPTGDIRWFVDSILEQYVWTVRLQGSTCLADVAVSCQPGSSRALKGMGWVHIGTCVNHASLASGAPAHLHRSLTADANASIAMRTLHCSLCPAVLHIVTAEAELAARRLTGSQAGTSQGSRGLGDEDDEAYEGEEELEELEEDEDSPDLRYPDVPTRVVQLSKLLDGVFAEDLADSVRGEWGICNVVGTAVCKMKCRWCTERNLGLVAFMG